MAEKAEPRFATIRGALAAIVIAGLFGASAQAAVIPDLQLEVKSRPVESTGSWTSWRETPTGTQEGENLYNYIGSASGGTFSLGWDVDADPDPIVNSFVSLLNNTGVTQSYITTVLLPIAPPITPTSVMGGSISGSVTESNGDTATLGTVNVPALPIYTALIDGVSVATLYNNPQAFTETDAFDSLPIASQTFGTPIPSAPGPQVLTNIGIQLAFTLSPGDQASFTSVFVVQVPEPASFGLVSMAAIVLVARRRRA